MQPTVAQVAITNLANTYSEDFNTLPQSASLQEDSWVDDTTLPNWFAENEYSETLNIRYGGNRHTGGSSERGLYSYGDRNLSDMALGVITRDASGDITYGVKYENQSGQTIQSVTVSYNGEQWRISNGQRPQVLGFSYLVTNSDPTIAFPERTSGYVYVPELYFTAPKFDTTGLNLAGATGLPLDGNSAENRVQITFSFNLTLADGEFLLLRWYKENSSKIEFGLAIDDLSVDFSNSPLTSLSFQSNAPIYHYIAGPIDLRIPDDTDVVTYDPPSTVESMVMNPEESTFRSMIRSVLTDDLSQARTDATAIGYELVTFTDATDGNKVHQVLRHNGAVDNLHHWGTYIFNVNPSLSNEYLSVPHPVNDSFTGRQGGYLYQQLDLAAIQIAGNYRCSSAVASGCHGSTTVCSGSTDFRESDAAHASEMPFHYASEEIADDNTNSHFTQLHGFGFVGGDPDLIISNGTDQAPSGIDHVVDFVNYIDNNSVFNAVGVHSDPYDDKLTGYTNTFGRYLNEHQGNICSSDQIANTTTDRFMHVEQRGELREIEANYDLIGDAILDFNSTILPLELLSFQHQSRKGVHQLEWTAQHADHVSHIEIQGSLDGVEFEVVGSVPGINTEVVVTYRYDILALKHTYYRLDIIDFDGYSELSRMIQVPNYLSGQVSVFPTVVRDICQVLAPEGADLQVFDAMGRKVNTFCLENDRMKLEVSGLKPGMYLLLFIQGNRREQRKIVVQR